jgi:hypothetical protein
MSKVLMIGSGRSATQFHDYDYIGNGWTIAVVNNAWKITDDWDYFIPSTDYKDRPVQLKPEQKIIDN